MTLSPQKFIAELTARRELAPDIFEVTFRLVEPQKLIYKAGNYLTVKVADGRKPPVFRAYTFAVAPRDLTQFKLCIKIFREKDGTAGRGSGYLAALKVGERAEFFGPAGAGSFAADVATKRPLILCGTGTGIAPLKAVAENLLHEGSTRPISLLLGVSYPADIFYREEFAALKKAHANFDFVIAVSRPPAGYADTAGRLPAVLEEMGVTKDADALVCGSEESTSGIKKKLLELGLAAERIDAEGYGAL